MNVGTCALILGAMGVLLRLVLLERFVSMGGAFPSNHRQIVRSMVAQNLQHSMVHGVGSHALEFDGGGQNAR